MWKLIKGYLIWNGVRTEGGAHMQPLERWNYRQYWWWSITDPNRKQERITNGRPQCTRYTSPFLQETYYPSNSTKEKPSSPWTLTFLQSTCFQNYPSQLPPFSPSNNFPLLCLLVLPMTFATTCSSWIAILCCSQINLFLLITVLFLRQQRQAE